MHSTVCCKPVNHLGGALVTTATKCLQFHCILFIPSHGGIFFLNFESKERMRKKKKASTAAPQGVFLEKDKTGSNFASVEIVTIPTVVDVKKKIEREGGNWYESAAGREKEKPRNAQPC